MSSTGSCNQTTHTASAAAAAADAAATAAATTTEDNHIWLWDSHGKRRPGSRKRWGGWGYRQDCNCMFHLAAKTIAVLESQISFHASVQSYVEVR